MAPNMMKVWDVGKTSREQKSISGDTDLSWTFWTCDLLSARLWNDHSSLWRNAEKQNKFWGVRSRENTVTTRLLSTAPLFQWSSIATASFLWIHDGQQTATTGASCQIVCEDSKWGLPNFSTGVLSGRKPCLRSCSIISSSSVWISETMLQGIRPTRSLTSAL